MASIRKGSAGLAFMAILLTVGTAGAVSDAQKCEAAKMHAVGKYAFCLEKGDAKAIKTGTLPDFGKCDSALATKWLAAESSSGGTCPTHGDEGLAQSFMLMNRALTYNALSGFGWPSCGDGDIDVAGEQCDGAFLGGATCASLGFAGGTLACDGSCYFDTSGCTSGCTTSGVPQTGQTQCDQGGGILGACPGSPAGQDGAVLAEAPRSYSDNGDGTITDTVTRLTWEKLSDDGSIHDWDNSYTWSDAFNVKIATLNSGGGFAGHTDWRLPNRLELGTLANLGLVNPAIDPSFSTACAPSCTVTTCSCTQVSNYWSSTTYQPIPSAAWLVSFVEGDATPADKVSFLESVRAVRGGL